jgi:hypothetical protein
MRYLATAALVAIGVGPWASSLRAQTDPLDEPITCWWRTDRLGVLVGERFTLTLTCRIAAAQRQSTIVDPSQFDSGALSVTPFEVVSVNHPDDLVVPGRKYFQYIYTVRLIGTTSFGQAVEIPPLVVTYTLQATNDKTPTRERVYMLPALPMRVLSVVPSGASDIREVAPPSFAHLEERNRRATLELTVAAIALSFAVVLLAGSLLRVVRSRSGRPAAASLPALSRRTILSACATTARRLREDARQSGWTPQLAARACAILRVAAATVLARHVTQSPARPAQRVRDGQLLVRSGLFKHHHTIVSSAVTASVIAHTIAVSPPRRTTDVVSSTRISEALAAFSDVRFGKETQFDDGSLDEQLEKAIDAIRRSRTLTLRPRRAQRVPATTTAAGAV